MPTDGAGSIETYAAELLDAVVEALPGYVTAIAVARAGDRADDVVAGIEAVSDAVVAEVEERLGRLLTADVDDQATTPLTVIRTAMRKVTSVLRDHDADVPERDPVDRRIAPDDPYALGPAAFGDLSERAQTAGIAWGAAKAHVILRRRHPPTPDLSHYERDHGSQDRAGSRTWERRSR